MKFHGLLIAALVLVVVSGLVYWSNQAEKAKEDEPDPDAPPKIIDIEEASIVKLEIQKEGEAATVLEKGGDGEWRITSPEPFLAEESSADAVVSAVAELESNRLIEENAADLSGFGLNVPKLTVAATQQDGTTLKLLVGDETPTGNNFFAKLDGDPRVFTLASYSKTSLEKTPWDLRDKRLLTFDSDKLSRVELTAKGPAIEIGKNAEGGWQIVKPRPLRADGGNVEQLVSRLRDAKMDGEMSHEELQESAGIFAKATRVATARVTDAAGTQELEVRKTADDDYYAKSSAIEGVYKITSTVGEGLDKGLDDLRNKKLFDFGWDEPTWIEIRDGEKTSVFEKSEDKWMKDGTQMDSASVRALIDELRDLTADSFPEEGFTEVYFEAKVVSNDGNREEKVLLSKSGEAYFAMRDGEPSIYGLKPVDADRLQAVADEVKEQVEDGEDAEEE